MKLVNKQIREDIWDSVWYIIELNFSDQIKCDRWNSDSDSFHNDIRNKINNEIELTIESSF